MYVTSLLLVLVKLFTSDFVILLVLFAKL